jgi:hypothetical protein
MGQAKLRAQEIQDLKTKLSTVHFFAIRHCKDGHKEIALSRVTLNPRQVNDRQALLREICLKDWLHTPPAGLIAEYLVQTKTYQFQSQMQTADIGYVINFHEVDQDNSRQYSCRVIMGMTSADLETWAADFAQQLNANGDYSVKYHA